jgi:hypothetical protein
MKSLIVALVGLGGIGIVYAIYNKSASTNQAKAQAKGVVDPNYDPRARVWAADQKSRMSGASGASNVVDVPCFPFQEVLESCGYPKNFVGPIPDTQTCGKPSITAFPLTGDAPPLASVSPYFWAADKVPINPNMVGSDADPNLAIDWSVV